MRTAGAAMCAPSHTHTGMRGTLLCLLGNERHTLTICREIQRLATRVRELELTLEQVKHNAVTTTDDKGPAPATSAILPSPPSPARPEVETVAASPFTGSMLKPPKRLWEGIFASTTQSSPKQVNGILGLILNTCCLPFSILAPSSPTPVLIPLPDYCSLFPGPWVVFSTRFIAFEC